MFFYIIIIVGIIIDLLTKYLASTYLQKKINLVGDLVFLKYSENTGIAFSVDVPSLILKILTISLIIGIFYYYKSEIKKLVDKKKIILTQVSFGLILSGAIGNGIERIFNGVVVDMIGVKYFAIFNVADSLITIGAIILIYKIYKYDRTTKV